MGDYPAEELTATGVIAGRSMRCKTASLEARHRLGYPLSVTDRHDLALLARRFGVAGVEVKRSLRVQLSLNPPMPEFLGAGTLVGPV
jgi:hypothetical protein